MRYLTADFGSTYTKLTAIDAENAKILGTATAFTTIATDITLGFNEALAKLKAHIGSFTYDQLLCCSSAGGGLKMVALGLVPELTAKAAKMAASSAGAKVVRTYSYEISQQEQDEISEINPDLVLLCGGTDGGNKEVIIKNAERLCQIPKPFSIIAAGNKSAFDDLQRVFSASDKDYVITKNVMPTFGTIAIGPAQESIRALFIKKIIDAKGLTTIQNMADAEIIPTPLAVLKGCELLSKGTQKTPGIGEFFAIDVGGATTDVYSMSKGAPTIDNVLLKGLPEPYAKRSVEGDLGMRYSIVALFDELDLDVFEEKAQATQADICAWVEKCVANPEIIAQKNSTEQRIDENFAAQAVKTACLRHCGIMEKVYTPMGELHTLNGKDLTNVPYVVGIGGALANSTNPVHILNGATFNMTHFTHMLPKNPQFLLDKKYIFSAMGVLSLTNPELALTIMKQEITTI